ncbi:hypothetical protein BCR34DRAFT_227040 [Clohesyomyces aquaticus]|uniref:Uncharacterized protein n=1 Tax=Clohesyomyces aquaticus TaxID=1231657 RepID=A0A1Y1Y852_9PLEO|nr:hypothetical protein BCR34DRAFT_227040 [Clohesyomyces aquaticus]
MEKRTINSRFRELHFAIALIQLIRPSTSKWTAQLAWFNDFVGVSPENLWIVDVNYAMLNTACPVALEANVRWYSDEFAVIDPTVDYESASVDDLLTAYHSVCPLGIRLHPRVGERIRSCFCRICPQGKTLGSTCTEIRAKLLRHGFDPSTHALIS